MSCPHGITLSIPSRLPEDPDRRVTVHFPKSAGQGCPLKAPCTLGDRGRTISLDGDDPARQAERERQQEATWQTHYRERPRMGAYRPSRRGSWGPPQPLLGPTPGRLSVAHRQCRAKHRRMVPRAPPSRPSDRENLLELAQGDFLTRSLVRSRSML